MRAGAQEPSRPYSEAIDVEIVNVDVMVVDREGAPVSGLSKEDFVLLVDGKPVEISNFSAYHTETTAAPSLAGPSTARQAAPRATWLIYVDLVRVGQARRTAAIRAVQNFLKNSVRPGDQILVACYDGNALRILEPLTTDVAGAVKALRRIESRLPSREFAALDLLPNPEAPTRPDLSEEEKERRIRDAIRGLRDLASIAGGIEGRIALLFVGGGYRMSEITDPHRNILLYTMYRQLLERLTEGRITAYTIFSAADFGGLAADSGGNDLAVDAPASADNTIDMASEISAFAQETGGIAMTARPGLEGQLERARQDFDSYYSLGFRPRSAKAGGKFEIDVDVRVAGARVRHRAAVGLRTDEQLAQDITMSALLLDAPPSNPWQLQLSVGPIPRGSRRAYRVPIVVAVPLGNVLFTEEPNGRQSAKLIFHFAIRDDKGNYQQLESRRLPLNMATKDLERVPREAIEYDVELLLAPGSNDLSVTVSDPAGRGRSSIRKTIVVGR